MLVVSGSYADTVVARHPEYLPHATRLDCQVTIDVGVSRETLILGVMRDALAESMSRPKPRRFTVDQWGSAGHTETVYIGSRSSQQFARVYDKELQSGDAYYAGCVRFEVQFKSELARAMGAALYASVLQPSYECAAICKAWFAQRGVQVPGTLHSPHYNLPRVSPPDTDDARTLRWLHRQVSPSIVGLLQRVSRTTIMQVLGLSDEDDRIYELDLETEDDNVA
jgi:DNA relaxase NicK